jgi:peptidyl-prolyl cis-trans isomerase C
LRILSLLAATVLALAAAGCGGGEAKVPDDAVAVVDGTPIPKSAFNALIAQARTSYKQQKRDFPKAGTQEYQQLQNQAVEFLVQREQFEQAAAEQDIEITDEQVENRLAEIKKQYFGGDEKKYQAQLKQQGLTDAQVRADIRAQIVSEKLFEKVTADIKVTDADVERYYEEHKDQYGTPEQREVRHILVKTKKLADDIVAQLKNGADFATLAKRYSEDPGSKDQGGKLTIARGQTVAAFDKKAFELKTNEISEPVKTEYGYHVIQAVGDIKPAKTTPLTAELKKSIREQLLQTRRNEAMTKWVEDLKKSYEDKVSYQTGFQPVAPVTGAEGDDGD